VLAQEEARALDHHYIGTEHILLGVIRGGDGVAAETLGALGVLLEPARDQVVKIIGRGEEPAGDLPFTPRAKKVLELSRGEAGELGASDVGPEHLLLGIVREGEGVAAQVLTRLDVDLADLRTQLISLVKAISGVQVRPAGTEPDDRTRDAIVERLDGIQDSLSHIAELLAEILRRLDGPA